MNKQAKEIIQEHEKNLQEVSVQQKLITEIERKYQMQIDHLQNKLSQITDLIGRLASRKTIDKKELVREFNKINN